jgi:hypothetical protein
MCPRGYVQLRRNSSKPVRHTEKAVENSVQIPLNKKLIFLINLAFYLVWNFYYDFTTQREQYAEDI